MATFLKAKRMQSKSFSTRFMNIVESKELIGEECKESMFDEERNSGNIHPFEVNNRNSRKRREVCSKFSIKTLERYHRQLSSVVILCTYFTPFLVFLLLTLQASIC